MLVVIAKKHILTVNVACWVHQEFKKISFGNQKPQDLVRLGPGVVSELEEMEVCVAFDVVEFVNAVPFTPSEDGLETDSEQLTLWKSNNAVRSKDENCEHQAQQPTHVSAHYFQIRALLQLQIRCDLAGCIMKLSVATPTKL